MHRDVDTTCDLICRTAFTCLQREIMQPFSQQSERIFRRTWIHDRQTTFQCRRSEMGAVLSTGLRKITLDLTPTLGAGGVFKADQQGRAGLQSAHDAFERLCQWIAQTDDFKPGQSWQNLGG